MQARNMRAFWLFEVRNDFALACQPRHSRGAISPSTGQSTARCSNSWMHNAAIRAISPGYFAARTVDTSEPLTPRRAATLAWLVSMQAVAKAMIQLGVSSPQAARALAR